PPTALPLVLSLPRRSAPPPGLRSFPTRRSSDLRRCACRQFLILAWSRLPPRQRPGAVPAGARRGSRRTPCPRCPVSSAAPTCPLDRKSTRLNSSHVKISYAVFCLKKKKQIQTHA